MSLNGLDASAVVEAHQAALADPCGWFLVKYTARDAVELLSRGTGGVIEAKNVVEQYDEKSPLYGLLHYRRKKVILKYVPAGTTRLVQVRVTVQFQSVLDAFSHDTVFSFATPSEFSESALGLSTMLQPTAHGTSLASSAASLKHRRLDEISEDAEEPVSLLDKRQPSPPASTSMSTSRDVVTPVPSLQNTNGTLPASAIKAKALLARRKEAELASNASTHTRGADSLTLTLKSTQRPSLDKSLPATPEQELTPLEAHPNLLTLRDDNITPPVPPKSVYRTEIPLPPRSELRNEIRYISTEDDSEKVTSRERSVLTDNARIEPYISLDHEGTGDYHSSHLTTTESKTISQWNDQVTAYLPPLSKPKKKLGPRPHIETPQRPRTSNTVGMPTTIRTSSRQDLRSQSAMSRPGSQQSSKSVPGRFAPGGPIPRMPSNSQLSVIIPLPSAHKPQSAVSSSQADLPNATPEKIRLMKALQMRKRNMILAQRAASSLSQRPTTALSGLPEENADEAEEANRTDASALAPAAKKEVAQTAVAVRLEHDSSTASPVSATTSGAQSTIPSSVSAEGERKASSGSSPDHTESSITPKADMVQDRGVSAQSPIDEPEELIRNTSGLPTVTEMNESEGQESEARRVIQKSGPEVSDSEVQEASPEQQNPSSKEALQPSQSQSQTANPLLSIPPRSSGFGGSLGFRRNSKRLTLTSNTGRSSANMSIYSDDSIMDDIQNATLHEAKPVSVARTPATPTMRKFSSDRIREVSKTAVEESAEQAKTASESIEQIEKVEKGDKVEKVGKVEKPRSASMKSNSTVQPYVTSDEPMPPLTNKSTLGSGISKRIKALEVLTHREPAQPAPSSPRDATTPKQGLSTLLNRTSFLSQFQSSRTSADKASKKASQKASSSTTEPEHEMFSESIAQRSTGTGPVVPTFRKGETISVTARIVRDNRRPATTATAQANEYGLNLHRSPLVVEHERHPSDPMSIGASSRDFSAKSFDTYNTGVGDKSRISLSSHRSGSTIKQYPTEGRTSRMSFMSRRSSKAASETSSVGEEKKASRTGRLMKRVSGFGGRFGSKGHNFGASKDHLPQQETILEQVEDERRQSISESMLQMIDIGDVNVQFPETLLWKRRFMRIDDQGFLIFSAPTDNIHIRTSSRKFHLSELKQPTLPDREREEMAWSILLDLKEGSCVQCACESKDAQEHILKMLLDAHFAYNSLYT